MPWSLPPTSSSTGSMNPRRSKCRPHARAAAIAAHGGRRRPLAARTSTLPTGSARPSPVIEAAAGASISATATAPASRSASTAPWSSPMADASAEAGDDGRVPGRMGPCSRRPPTRVDGELVLMPGDANLARGAHIDAPIRLEIRNDHITTIDGDHASADVLRALLERFERWRRLRHRARSTLGTEPGPSPARTGPVRRRAARSDRRAAAGRHRDRSPSGRTCIADRPCPGSSRDSSLPGRHRSPSPTSIALSVEGELVGALAPDVYEAPG